MSAEEKKPSRPARGVYVRHVGESVGAPSDSASTRATIARTIHEAIPCPTDKVTWEQTRGAENGSATLNDQKDMRLVQTGKSTTNEDGVLAVCERLVRVLVKAGAHWGTVALNTTANDVDAWASAPDGALLEMQVIRASVNSKRYAALTKTGQVDEALNCDDAADELCAAVTQKAKYPVEQRRKLTLVLDATKLASHTFAQVFESFHRRHGDTCKAYEFHSIWVVGSTDAVVTRLDI